eukprot:SAG31_NODE_482_length_15056_cov_5.057364_15_plen_112_part_00
MSVCILIIMDFGRIYAGNPDYKHPCRHPGRAWLLFAALLMRHEKNSNLLNLVASLATLRYRPSSVVRNFGKYHPRFCISTCQVPAVYAGYHGTMHGTWVPGSWVQARRRQL